MTEGGVYTMPLIKSAKKKMKQDKKRTKINTSYSMAYKKALQEARKHKGLADVNAFIKKAYEKVDKAMKKGILHKNKASRLKSSMSRFLSKK